MKSSAANEERLARLRTKLTKLGIFAYLLLQLEVVASLWGRWSALVWFAALFGVGAAMNLSVNRLVPRIGSRQVERIRGIASLAIILAICHLSGWGFPALAMVVLIGAAQGAANGPEAVGLVAVVAVLSTGVAAADGAGWLTALSLGTAVQGAFWLVYGSARVGTDLLEELAARHRELAVAHAELGKMQRVALQQEKLAGLGMMAAGVAHEINNPMSYVTSNVVALLAELRAAHGLPAGLREYVDEVLPETIDGIRRVNSIVADLRRFSRSDAVGSEDYDLNEQVEHALRISQNQLKQRCHVVRELGVLPELSGRPQQITQVLVNLLVNAAQAIVREGTVTVATRATATEAIVSVSDTGAGMSAETRMHLFEPFFTTKPAGEGTGLGLAVIHGIVTAHGGRIEVESDLGRGSCFTLRLPLTPSLPEGPGVAPPRPEVSGLQGASL